MHESLGQFFNCGVDLFLFISGYLYGGKVIKYFRKWYCKRVITVAIPAIIISVVVIIVLFLVGERISIGSIIAYCTDLEGFLFIKGDAVPALFEEIPSLGPLWFTTVIMICYLFVPLIQFLSSKARKPMFSMVIVFILGSVVYVFASKYISLFYFVIFTMGYFSKKINLLEKINARKFIAFTVVFVAFIFGRIIMKSKLDDTFVYVTYVTITQFFIGMWFIILFAFLYNRYTKATLKIAQTYVIRIMEQYSFFIYLCHGIFCVGCFNLYEKLSLPIATLLFIVCTLLSAILLRIISMFIKKAFIENYYFS